MEYLILVLSFTQSIFACSTFYIALFPCFSTHLMHFTPDHVMQKVGPALAFLNGLLQAVIKIRPT